MFTTHALFHDRADAGRQLAEALLLLKLHDPLILALPRGGVPVAYEVARALRAPLDVFLVRKIGAPYFPELGIGAVAEGEEPYCFLNLEMAQRVRASEDYLADEQKRQLEEIARRRERYRGGRPLLGLRGRTVVLVDDGIATGGTMKAALQAVSAALPLRLLFAVPVAPPETVAALAPLANEYISLHAPHGFRAVSQFYEDFDQTSDEEVIRLLREAEESIPATPHEAGPEHEVVRLRQPPSDQADGRF